MMSSHIKTRLRHSSLTARCLAMEHGPATASLSFRDGSPKDHSHEGLNRLLSRYGKGRAMPKTESGTGLLAPRPPEVFRYGQALGPSADAVRLSSGRPIVIESVRLPC